MAKNVTNKKLEKIHELMKSGNRFMTSFRLVGYETGNGQFMKVRKAFVDKYGLEEFQRLQRQSKENKQSE